VPREAAQKFLEGDWGRRASAKLRVQRLGVHVRRHLREQDALNDQTLREMQCWQGEQGETLGSWRFSSDRRIESDPEMSKKTNASSALVNAFRSAACSRSHSGRCGRAPPPQGAAPPAPPVEMRGVAGALREPSESPAARPARERALTGAAKPGAPAPPARAEAGPARAPGAAAAR